MHHLRMFTVPVMPSRQQRRLAPLTAPPVRKRWMASLVFRCHTLKPCRRSRAAAIVSCGVGRALIGFVGGLLAGVS